MSIAAVFALLAVVALIFGYGFIALILIVAAVLAAVV